MHRYFALHKPYEMLSQFIGGAAGLRSLSDLDGPFPEGIHAVGRLDYQSEGLLLLTTDTSITRRLFQGAQPHRRCYLVQVYREMSEATLAELRAGTSIRIKGGGYHTAVPADVKIVERPAFLPSLPHELPPARPQTWLEVTLTEGRYHQVRKMLRAVRHPVQRLVRTSIEGLALEDLGAGEVQEFGREDFFGRLRL